MQKKSVLISAICEREKTNPTNTAFLNEELTILIQGCCQYNRQSQEKLYKLYYKDLYALCYKFFDDEQDRITALNDGMLNVFNNIEKYNESKGNFYGWMYIIVRNAAISIVRTKFKAIKTQEVIQELKVETVQPNLQESKELVEQYLKHLTFTTRAVFSLFYVEGLLIKEIAVLLKMKEGTVKWHLNDGRQKLKSIFINNDNQINYAK